MVQWRTHTFSELTPEALYQILRLREQVFQLEQQCIYPDLDNVDQRATHMMGLHDGDLTAYARLYEKENNLMIGRVVTATAARGQGLGRELIRQCLQYFKQHHTGRTIKISAQHHLQNFYQSFGFIAIGDPYDEDGIPHIAMTLELDAYVD